MSIIEDIINHGSFTVHAHTGKTGLSISGENKGNFVDENEGMTQ